MHVKPELISKFLSNSCTAEEAEEVVAFLQANPEALDQYFPLSEWEENTLDDIGLPDQRALFIKIHKQLNAKKAFRKKMFVWAKAAALILTVLGAIVVYRFYIRSEITEKSFQVREVVSKAPSYFLHKVNAGNTIMKLSSADGSYIELYPGGELRYPEYFDGLHSRDFELKGKAYFKVIKDKRRPFIVHSNRLTTTALGTSFIIDAPKNSDKVKVNLLSGKVLVKEEKEKDDKIPALRYYLEPGNELLVDSKKLTAMLTPKPAKRKISNRSVRGERIDTDSTIQFKNQSLIEIINYLENHYGVQVNYESKKLKNHYYSGSFRKNKGVEEAILRDIVLLNNLSIEKNAQTYIIK